ncbi:MAG: patatin-like phospholipase family protein [Algoriphagus sp.]|uniref:patatin-like phospholipase family protein n=1 Tax=Algoriphagus sp. TaxID=1872435 RepID=UPI0017BC2CD5|nr:patatin-like phospholipase family protein [Algoriphagus sp.]NVJ84825.1 patatin-like phospholipase family protein [Algoriphagus sp.]
MGFFRLRIIFSILLLCLSSHYLIGQVSSEKPARIGLVLSGGGAKGIAHVGIIKAMEEAGLRPDFIVGTSMGSVIGGLYSIGYSAEDLEEIIRSTDWDLVVSNRVDFKDIAFEEKEYYNRYLVEIPFNKGKMTLPSGLIHGQVLSEVLHYYTFPAAQYESFDQFPIPFRCIATDVRTGEPIVFDKGYLHDAIRSSIAIPTAFTAFNLDSTLVVDGGVVNNFPVDIVRSMGADFVIGVNVSDEDFLEIEELGGFGGILMQIAMSESLRKTSANIEDTDIYIKPDLGPYSTGSFGEYDAILKLGESTGKVFFDRFKKAADSLGVKNLEKDEAPVSPELTIRSIQVEGNKLFSDEFIKSKLGVSPGQTVNRDFLQEAVRHVFGVNGFYKVDYSLRQVNESEFDLIIRTIEKPKTTFSTALHYDNVFSVGLLANWTIRNWIGNSSRTVLVADISRNPKFRFDHYKYLGPQKKVAINFRFNYLRQEFPGYENGELSRINIFNNSRTELQLITTNSLKEAFYFGFITDMSRSKLQFDQILPDGVKNGIDNYVSIRARYYRNSQDDRNFPTRGAEGLLEAEYRLKTWLKINLDKGVDTIYIDGGRVEIPVSKEEVDQLVESLMPNSYLTLLGRYSKLFPLSESVQIKPSLGVGLTISNESEKSFRDFFVGGYQMVRFIDNRFWGLNYAEITAQNFGKVGLELQVIPIKKIFLRGGANWLGYSSNTPVKGILNGDVFSQNTLIGYGADISYQSILGPITLGLGSNSVDKKLRTYLSIGFSLNYQDR